MAVISRLLPEVIGNDQDNVLPLTVPGKDWKENHKNSYNITEKALHLLSEDCQYILHTQITEEKRTTKIKEHYSIFDIILLIANMNCISPFIKRHFYPLNFIQSIRW